MTTEAPEKNLGLDLVRVTEAAALASTRWLGKGDKEGGDGAAVKAMRTSFNTVPMKGTIIIGEGEKDKAPMLYLGEEVGTGEGSPMDIALDPVDGTTLLANGMPGSIAVVAAAPAGSMYNLGHSFYMDKLVVPEGVDNVDLNEPTKDIVAKVAKAMDKRIEDIVVFMLNRKRNQKLVEEIREIGAKIRFSEHGDVMGALMAASPHFKEVDMMIGSGGSPEGVIAACAVKAFGAHMFVRMAPQSEEEKQVVLAEGADLNLVLSEDELIKSDDTVFAATAISGGEFMHGVQYLDKGVAVTHSMVLRSKTRTVRFIEAYHDLNKIMQFSSISY